MKQDLIRHSPGAALVPDDAWGNTLGVTPATSYPGTSSTATPRENTPMQRLHRVLRGRYFAAIVLGGIGAAVGAAWGYLTPTPVYRSTGLLVISPVRESLRGDSPMSGYTNWMNNEAAQIRINDFVTEAMDQSVWTDKRGAENYNVADFQNRLSTKFLRDSFQIQVSFESPNDKLAEAGVQAVLQTYEENHAARAENNIGRKITELDRLISERRTKELDLAAQVADRTSKYPTDDVGTQMQPLQDKLQGFLDELSTLELNYAAASKFFADNQNKRGPINLSQFVQIDPVLGQLYQQRSDLYNRIQQDIASYGETHPNVTNGARRYSALTAQINSRATMLAETAGMPIAMPDGSGMQFVNNALLSNMSLRMDYLQNEIDKIRPRLGDMTADRKTIAGAAVDLERVRDERGGYERQREAMQIDAALNGGELKTAVLGDKPTMVEDNRKKMAMVGAVLGAGIPIGLLVLFGLMDTRYRFSDEANEDSDLTLLGILPNLPDRLSDPAQASIAAHCVHQIRTMLQLGSIREGEPACFAISSASSGDGKTSLTLALGLSFAASGSRTLLIDTDLVGGGLSARLEVSGGEGVLEAVTSRQLLPYVQDTDVADLSLLPVGAAQLHHAGNFSPSAVRRIIEQAKKHFDIVLIDTGPLLGAIESTPVCAAADGVLLTVARGQNRPLVDKALAHLRGIGATVAGVVFNKARNSDFEQSINGMSLQSQHRSANAQRKNGPVGALPSGR